MTLIDRLSKLEGPDRGVDAEIDVLFFGGETVWKTANYTMEQFPTSKRDSKHHICGYAYEHVPAYTFSVDAAIALAERVLPGWKWGIHHHRGLIRAYVSETSPFRPMPVIADHGVPAIALLIALLRAKEASKL